jgi:hypothetical protein
VIASSAAAWSRESSAGRRRTTLELASTSCSASDFSIATRPFFSSVFANCGDRFAPAQVAHLDRLAQVDQRAQHAVVLGLRRLELGQALGRRRFERADARHLLRSALALERRGQHRRQRLAPRARVVARDPVRELQQVRPDERLLVEHRGHELDLVLLECALRPRRHHDADLAPRPERHRDAHAGRDLVLERERNPVRELDPQRPVQRDVDEQSRTNGLFLPRGERERSCLPHLAHR